MKNIAYIDGANLQKALPDIDYQRFYDYLSKKHKTSEIFIFLGHLKSQEKFYKALKKNGYKIVFKEAVRGRDGKTKANIDVELTIKATQDFYEHKPKQTVLISGDGDFASLVDFWKDKKVKAKILAPDEKSCSYLLKKRKIWITYLRQPKIYNQIKKTKKLSLFQKILRKLKNLFKK
jgi:uncharacterized LabA/DUF88 family protein